MDGTLWRIVEHVVDFSKRGLIMGVLNVTPDSLAGEPAEPAKESIYGWE